MKPLGISLSALVCLLFTTAQLTAAAVDVTGDWEGAYYTEVVKYQTAGASLLQDGNAVSGTYTTSTGLTGTMTGTIDGTTFEFSIVHTGTCTGFFLGTAELRGEVLIMDMGGFDCASAGSVSARVVLARNRISIAPWVSLSLLRRPPDVQSGNLWCALNETDPEEIRAASIVTPTLDEFSLAFDEEDGRWECSLSDIDAQRLTQIFPNGIYYFPIEYKDGTTATAGTIHQADFPSAFPEITQPTHGDVIDPSSALNVAWQKADSSVDSIYASIGDLPGSMYPLAATGFTVPGGSLSDDALQDVWLSFGTDSPYCCGNKGRVAQIDFFTGSRLVDSSLILVNAQAPSGQVVTALISDLYTIGASSGNLLTPKGETLPFVYDPIDKAWEVEIFTTSGEAATRFPDGDYRLGAGFLSGPDENKTIPLSGALPQSIPNITSPLNGATIDKQSSTLDIQWDPWVNGAGVILVEIKKIGALPADNGFNTSYQANVWEDFFSPDTTRASVPVSLLDPGSTFELAVMFINPANDNAFKGSRSHIFLQTNCDHAVHPTRMGVDYPGGAARADVSAADCLSWSAESNAGWIGITSGRSGSGNGTVSYTVSENWRTTPRDGTLTVSGETVKVHQLAGQTPCTQDPVEVEETQYYAFQDGYAGAAAGDTVKCQYADLTEDIQFNRNVSVTVVGGYNCDYSANPDFTTVQGKLVFGAGTVAVEKIIVAGP